jgi:hypothetical protein
VDQVITRQGAAFYIATGDSIYTASQALLMPGFAEAVDGPIDPHLGWLLSVPNRHELSWHVVRNGEDSLSALVGMTLYTPAANAESAGPLSPHVFWWSGEGYRPVTGYAADGTVTGFLDKEFERALESATGTADR